MEPTSLKHISIEENHVFQLHHDLTSWISYVTLHCASPNVGHHLINVSCH